MRTFTKVFSASMIMGTVVMLGVIAFSVSAVPVSAAEPNETDTEIETPAGSLGVSMDDGLEVSFSGAGTGGSVSTSDDGNKTEVTLEQSMEDDTADSASTGLCAVGLSDSESPISFDIGDDSITMEHDENAEGDPDGVTPEEALECTD